MVRIAENERIQIDKFTLGAYGTNSYVITCRRSSNSVVIDAPAEANKVMEALKGTNPRYILMTHSHMDHVGALAELKSRLGIPVAAHQGDANSLPLAPDMLLSDGDTVSFGQIKLKVLHTPGHTPGSLCLLTEKYLISGDTIFPAGPGKTRAPAQLQQIIESITAKIFTLPDDTPIFPGHGDSTTVKKAKAEYAIFASRPHSPDLCGDVLWLES
ncbi:MBL fold metallo-hydrolase [Chloroflexota bacterium]